MLPGKTKELIICNDSDCECCVGVKESKEWMEGQCRDA